jgi:hypothetical protein
MFCVFFFFFFFIGTYPNVYPYSSLPVGACTVPVLYLYYSKVVVYRSTPTLRLGQHGVRSTTLPTVSRETFPFPSPLPYASPRTGMGWDANPTPCYYPPIPWPDEVGHDPRVCVHPTLLPP